MEAHAMNWVRSNTTVNTPLDTLRGIPAASAGALTVIVSDGIFSTHDLHRDGAA